MEYLKKDLKRFIVENGGIEQASRLLGITVAETLGYLKGKRPKERRVRQFLSRGLTCSVEPKMSAKDAIEKGFSFPVDKRTLKSLEKKNPWLFAELVNAAKAI